MKIVFSRDVGIAVGNGDAVPGGVYGHMSFERLCDTLEKCGEARPTENISHLVIDPERGMIDIRYEAKNG